MIGTSFLYGASRFLPACAFLFVCLLAAGQTDPLVLKSQRAKQAMAERRFEEAAALYAELVRAIPGNPGLVMNLGLAQYSGGKYAEAVRQFEAVLKLQPGFPPALTLLGVSWQKLGQPARAIAPLARAVEAEPGNRIALLELADACLATGAADRAAQYFSRLSEIDPANAKAWQGLGLSHLALARKAFELLPEGSPYWYALLARSKLEEHQLRTAFSLYKKALEGDPNLPGAHAALARIYRETGHADWAAVEEQREKTIKPSAAGNPDYFASLEHSRKALEAFERLAQLPPSAGIHELTAEAHSVQGRHKAAAEELEKALKLAPAERRLMKALLQPLLRNEPSSGELNFYTGDSLLSLEGPEPAIPHLQAAVKHSPALLEAHAALGKAYLHQGEAEKAIDPLRRALAIDDDGSLHFQLARALERAGRAAEAAPVRQEFERLSKGYELRRQKTEAERQISAP